MGVSHPFYLSGDEPYASLLRNVVDLVVDVSDLLYWLLVSLFF